MKNLLVLVLASLLSTTVFAAPKSTEKLRKSVEACMNEDASTMGMRMCLGEGQAKADPALAAIVAKISKDSASEKEVLKRFKASQKAWVAYRLAQCSYNSSEMLGGTGEPLIYDMCTFEMTVDRIDYLEEHQ